MVRGRQSHGRAAVVRPSSLSQPRKADVPEVPKQVVQYIAEQVGVEPEVFEQYGERDNTVFEHLDELRREFGFQNCGWTQLHALGNELLPLALESDRSLPLIETAIERLRTQQVIAPGITTLERLVWTVQRLAQRRVEGLLLQPLSRDQRARLDALVQVDPELRTRTRLSWLREAPELPSAKSLRKVLERLTYLRGLELQFQMRDCTPTGFGSWPVVALSTPPSRWPGSPPTNVTASWRPTCRTSQLA